MKIFRVAEESLVPSWISTDKTIEECEKSNPHKDVDRLNATASEQVTEDLLAKECTEIEKCAASNKPYHYNSNWNKETVGHLKEYASAVGLDKSKMIGVDPVEMTKYIKANKEECLRYDNKRSIEEIEDAMANGESVTSAEVARVKRHEEDLARSEITSASSKKIVKIASTAIAEKPSKLVLSDPFHLDKFAETTEIDKRAWETVGRQSDLDDRPQMNVGVRPMRGGEDYLKNSDPKVAGNQNTISQPNKIKEMAESKTIDTGARLKQEKIDKNAAKVQERKDWEKNVIAAMEKKDIVPHGNVFPTEVMNAQSGLKNPSSKMGVYAKFDKNSIPELTEGEKIRGTRKEWNDNMKRAEKEKATFEMSKHSTREISDTFGDSLKKALKK